MMTTLPVMTPPARVARERGKRASTSQELLTRPGIRTITVAPRVPDCAREVPGRIPWSATPRWHHGPGSRAATSVVGLRLPGPRRHRRPGLRRALRRLAAERGADPGDDLGGGRARGEDPGHAHPGQFPDVLVRDDAAAEHHDVGGVPLLEQLDHPAEERHVRAGEDGEPDGVHVLLDGRRHDLLRRLVQPGVDDLYAGIAQCAGHHLCPAVVTVKADLRDDHPDLAHDGKRSRNVQADGARLGPPGRTVISRRRECRSSRRPRRPAHPWWAAEPPNWRPTGWRWRRAPWRSRPA